MHYIDFNFLLCLKWVLGKLSKQNQTKMAKIFTNKKRKFLSIRKSIVVLLCWGIVGQFFLAMILSMPSADIHSREEALKFWHVATTILMPVYGPLADQIVSEFQLADKKGIGIDIGSGPGTLIIEICKRAKQIYWINADINPYFFPLFFDAAKEAGVGHHVSAILADAHALPFRNDYADIIVSRGSFHFWTDKRLAISEVYRVLKPGGIAFIGRGFSNNLPVETARKIRAKQNGGPKYDLNKAAAELREIMKTLGIKEYRIRIPKPPGSEDVNYGIWLEFRKTGEYERILYEFQGHHT
ncbi:MAG: class I SAM-dependent methyltransferase [Acidobacteriota bacterium]|nr:class I SAM-dependent methyltransferase [Acidobacteriota bacterium]